MDEREVRDMLHKIASDEAPPSRVNLSLALSKGLRRRRTRRVYRAAAPPVAAAAAVALIAGLPQVLTTPSQHHAPVAHTGHRPAIAPKAFNLLEPLAVFGWLPPRYTASPRAFEVSAQDSESSDGEFLLASGGSAARTLGLYLATRDVCHIALVRSVQHLQCAKITVPGPPIPGLISSRAPSVDGRSAYWLKGSSGTGSAGLAWQYAKSGWAILLWSGGLPDHVHKVAASVRYNSAKFRYGFELRGASARWPQPAYYGPQFAFFDDLPAPTSADFSPAKAGVPPLMICVLPASLSAPTAPACLTSMASPVGRRSTVTLDGTKATLWTLNTGSGRYQTLYDPNIRDVAVAISLSPAPGSGKLGGVLGVFHDMHLLGSNVRSWTTNPLG